MDYKRKEYNLILKPWITKEKSITLFLILKDHGLQKKRV